MTGFPGQTIHIKHPILNGEACRQRAELQMLVIPTCHSRGHRHVIRCRQRLQELPDRRAPALGNQQTQVQLIRLNLADDGWLRQPIANRGFHSDIATLDFERQSFNLSLVAEKSDTGIEILNVPINSLGLQHAIRQPHPSGYSPRLPVRLPAFDLQRELEVPCFKSALGDPSRETGNRDGSGRDRHINQETIPKLHRALSGNRQGRENQCDSIQLDTRSLRQHPLKLDRRARPNGFVDPPKYDFRLIQHDGSSDTRSRRYT